MWLVAATVQFSLPVIAAGGTLLLLGEPVTLRLAFSSVAILGGTALVVLGRPNKTESGRAM